MPAMSDKPTVNLVLVDDHPMVRDGVISCLQFYPEINIVGTANNGAEAIEVVNALQPDVVLMDISMPDMNGIDATEAIIDASSSTRVLIFSMHDNAEFVSSAVQAGASGYILKNTDAEEVHHAVTTVASGKSYFAEHITQLLLKQNHTEKSRLTTREQTILSYLAQGLSSKQIANEVNISTRTVEAHRRNIKAKLQLDTLAELVRYAVEHGLVSSS